MVDERRGTTRSKFAYYMRVFNDDSHQLVGYLADISQAGFQLDSSSEIPVDQDYLLRLELTVDISESAFIVFEARSRWCRPNIIDPSSYDVGFQVVKIAPEEDEIFQRIVAKYGGRKTS